MGLEGELNKEYGGGNTGVGDTSGNAGIACIAQSTSSKRTLPLGILAEDLAFLCELFFLFHSERFKLTLCFSPIKRLFICFFALLWSLLLGFASHPGPNILLLLACTLKLPWVLNYLRTDGRVPHPSADQCLITTSAQRKPVLLLRLSLQQFPILAGKRNCSQKIPKAKY